MKKLVITLLGAAVLMGCQNGKLDQTGPYGSGSVLGTNYVASSTNAMADGAVLFAGDSASVAAYNVLHGFVNWEYTNRKSLSQYPEVTKYADYVRANAKQWFVTAFALRAAYVDNPTAKTQSDLQTALSVIATAISQSQSYMTAHSNIK